MDMWETRDQAEFLMGKYGLLDQGWRLEFMNGKRLLGQCNYRRKVIRISRWLVELGTNQEVMDTIKHEIAHALTPGHKHDWTWKLKAIEVGAEPRACKSTMSYEVPHRYEIICSWCGTTIQKRHRKMNLRRLATASHTACGQASQGHLEQRQVSW